MYQIIIKNGIVIDPANRFHGQADVAVAEGKIAGIGQYSNDAVMVVDASDGSPKEGAVCKGALRSGARPHGPVSYTHLDVYKRQCHRSISLQQWEDVHSSPQLIQMA